MHLLTRPYAPIPTSPQLNDIPPKPFEPERQLPEYSSDVVTHADDNLLVSWSAPMALEEYGSEAAKLIDNIDSEKISDFSQPHYASLDVRETGADEESSSEKMFSQRAFEQCYARILRNSPDLKKIIQHDSATMYKQMIAWVVRCGLTGAMWTAGYTLGAVLDKADPSSAGKSKMAWVSASIGQGLAEMLCVLFIGYYLSDPKVTFRSNSNGAGFKQNLVEGAVWGASCLTGGALWQPAVNRFCSSDDLAKFAPSCMATVGTLTGASFAATLACIKALIRLSQACCKTDSQYFRTFNTENTISDSLLFGQIVVGMADAFFVMTSTNSPFNYRPYSEAEQFELLPTLTQMGYSALSTMLGGLAAFALRGGINGAFHLYDHWGDTSRQLRTYVSKISLNSQCVIL